MQQLVNELKLVSDALMEDYQESNFDINFKKALSSVDKAIEIIIYVDELLRMLKRWHSIFKKYGSFTKVVREAIISEMIESIKMFEFLLNR